MLCKKGRLYEPLVLGINFLFMSKNYKKSLLKIPIPNSTNASLACDGRREIPEKV